MPSLLSVDLGSGSFFRFCLAVSQVATLVVYLRFSYKPRLVSPPRAVCGSQHKVPSYQEATADRQVILGSDNFQIRHVRAGVWLAFRASNDLP